MTILGNVLLPLPSLVALFPSTISGSYQIQVPLYRIVCHDDGGTSNVAGQMPLCPYGPAADASPDTPSARVRKPARLAQPEAKTPGYRLSAGTSGWVSCAGKCLRRLLACKSRMADGYGCIPLLRDHSMTVTAENEYGYGGILRHISLSSSGDRPVGDSVVALDSWV